MLRKYPAYILCENKYIAQEVRNVLTAVGTEYSSVGSFVMVFNKSLIKVRKYLRKLKFKTEYVNLRWLDHKALIVFE